MRIREIPLKPTSQQFLLAVDGITYRVRLLWSEVTGAYLLDLSINAGQTIVRGISVVTGADIVQQFHSAGIAFGISAYTDFDADAVPTFENLGINAHVVVVEP